MNKTKKSLGQIFIDDLDNIATNFIDIFQLKYTSEVSHLGEPLFRWLDFRLRYIDQRPRQILYSNKFPKKLDKKAEQSLQLLIKKVQNGEDINPYQGKGLILHHDTSGSKRQNRTDLLWADWGIIHLHLCDKPIPSGKYFSERSKWLLFVLVGADYLAAIDIRDHNEINLFENNELIEIVAKSWPELLAPYELKSILPPKDSPSAEERKKLRKSGLSGFITVDEKTYMGPGMSITSASTSMRVSNAAVNARRYAKELAKIVISSGSEFQEELKSNNIANPKFNLCITPKGMAIYEANLDRAWLLPKKVPNSSFNYVAQLNDWIAPDWAAKRVRFND